MNIGQRILWCNSCHFNISVLAQLNDCIGGLLHLGPNVITFRALLHLGPNVITFRTLLHLGQLLHLGLQQNPCGFTSYQSSSSVMKRFVFSDIGMICKLITW